MHDSEMQPKRRPGMSGGVILDGIPCIYSADGERGSNQLTQCQTQNSPLGDTFYARKEHK